MDKGTKTRQKCANACKKRVGCVAFDLCPVEKAGDKADAAKGELQCNLYGHPEVVPASAVPGNCYALIGAEAVASEDEGHEKAAKRPIIDDGALDKLTTKGEESFSLRKQTRGFEM